MPNPPSRARKSRLAFVSLTGKIMRTCVKCGAAPGRQCGRWSISACKDVPHPVPIWKVGKNLHRER